MCYRNDLDSKYKELCNCCAACVDLIRIQCLTLGMLPVSPSTGHQRSRLNEGVKNVTDSGAWKRLGKVVHATHGLRDAKGYEDG